MINIAFANIVCFNHFVKCPYSSVEEKRLTLSTCGYMKEKSGVIVGQKYNDVMTRQMKGKYILALWEKKCWSGGFTFYSVFSVFVIVNFLCCC